jgi:hypothetical protein
MEPGVAESKVAICHFSVFLKRFFKIYSVLELLHSETYVKAFDLRPVTYFEKTIDFANPICRPTGDAPAGAGAGTWHLGGFPVGRPPQRLPVK